MSPLKELIEEFVDQLSATIEGEAIARARKAVEQALGGRGVTVRLGRIGSLRPSARHANGTNGFHVNGTGLHRRPRKKAPIQLCPVPGCKERAAPIFGMVCAKHKDVPKAQIKKYREARRAKKLGGAAPAAARAKRKPAARAAKKATARKPARRAARKAPSRPEPVRASAPPSAATASAAA
jgi:hypothetical protein